MTATSSSSGPSPEHKDASEVSTTNSGSSTIQNRDMLALKAFVQAQDHVRYDHLNPQLVLLDLTHSNLKQRHIEIRFSRHDTLAYLKNRIHLKTGTPPHHQHLIFYDGTTELAQVPATSNSDSTTGNDQDQLSLGYFGLDHGMRVHCIDVNPLSESAHGGYEDTSLVAKYVMTDDAYNARKGTLRDWSRQQKQAKPNFSLHRHAAQQRAKSDAIRLRKAGLPLPPGFYIDSRGELEYDSDYERDQQQQRTKDTVSHASTASEPKGGESFQDPAIVQDMTVGSRCQVEPGRRRGTIRHVGEIPELGHGGYWIGIQLDEPVGQNDGHVQDKVYIPNLPPGSRYGLFVRPHKVQVGDFPERDLLDDSDDDDEPTNEMDSEDEL